MQTISLRWYILKRILQGIVLIFFIIIINFALLHAAPGNPIDMLVGPMGADPAYIQMMTEKFALDKPLQDQLLAYIFGVMHGDFGMSFWYLCPVMDLIVERAPHTLVLAGTATAFAYVLGTVLGVVSARKQYSLLDHFATVFSLIGYSIPTFWLGQMLIMIFAIWLNLLPSGGIMSVRLELAGWSAVVDRLVHLILPTVTLGSWYLALVTRLTRGSMLEVLKSDFITFARSKGLSQRAVLYKHALKNAMLPVITIIGVSISSMLTGAILTETVYSWPGLGRLLYESVVNLDYPVLMGLLVVVSISVIIISLAIDILYVLIDPRIKYR